MGDGLLPDQMLGNGFLGLGRLVIESGLSPGVT